MLPTERALGVLRLASRRAKEATIKRRLYVVHHCERSCQTRAGVEPPVVSLKGTHDECSTYARKCNGAYQVCSKG